MFGFIYIFFGCLENFETTESVKKNPTLKAIWHLRPYVLQSPDRIGESSDQHWKSAKWIPSVQKLDVMSHETRFFGKKHLHLLAKKAMLEAFEVETPKEKKTLSFFGLVWVVPLPSNSHHQDCYVFRIGDPNLNLHFPLASWEGGQPKVLW